MTQKQQVTVAEFKSWLQGISEMLGNDWVPTSDQWVIIKAKVDTLCDTSVPTYATPQQSSVGQPHSQNVPPSPPSEPPPLVQPGPSSLSAMATTTLQPPRMVQSPAGVNMMVGNAPFANGSAGTAGMPVKTPTIEAGPYQSAFS